MLCHIKSLLLRGRQVPNLVGGAVVLKLCNRARGRGAVGHDRIGCDVMASYSTSLHIITYHIM